MTHHTKSLDSICTKKRLFLIRYYLYFYPGLDIICGLEINADKCELWYFTLPNCDKTLKLEKCYIHVYGWTEISACHHANTALGMLQFLLTQSAFQACTKTISSTLPCHIHFS